MTHSGVVLHNRTPCKGPARVHTEAKVAHIAGVVADGAEWCELVLCPLLGRDTVCSVAVITKAPCLLATINTRTKQHLPITISKRFHVWRCPSCNRNGRAPDDLGHGKPGWLERQVSRIRAGSSRTHLALLCPWPVQSWWVQLGYRCTSVTTATRESEIVLAKTNRTLLCP